MDNVKYTVRGLMTGGFVDDTLVFRELTRDQVAKMFDCRFSMFEKYIDSKYGWRGMLINAWFDEAPLRVNYGDFMYSLYNAEGDLVNTHYGYEHIGLGIGEMCEIIGHDIPWVGTLFQEIPVGDQRLRRTLAFRVPSSLYKGKADLVCGNCAGRGRNMNSILSLNIRGGIRDKSCIMCECSRPDSFSLKGSLSTVSELEENTSAMSALNLFCLNYKDKVDESLEGEGLQVVFDIFDGAGKPHRFKTAAHALIAINPDAVRLDQDFTLEEYIVNYNRGLCVYPGCTYNVVTDKYKIPSDPLHAQRILKVLHLMDLK